MNIEKTAAFRSQCGADMYLLGPYRQQLTWDYYSLAKNPEKYGNAMKATARDQFFELVRNRDSEWLEVACSG